MLGPIDGMLRGDSDLPDISNYTREYLQARFSYAFLEESGYLDALKKGGYCEAFLAGVVKGFHAAAKELDTIEILRNQQSEQED